MARENGFIESFVLLRARKNRARASHFFVNTKMECPACAIDDPSQINHMEYGGCLSDFLETTTTKSILSSLPPIPEVEETCEGCLIEHPSQRYHMGPGGCLNNA